MKRNLFVCFLTSVATLCGVNFNTHLEYEYNFLCQEPSDINEHLPVLRSLAMECSSVVEIGLRTMVSSCAILKGLSEYPSAPRSYLGIDIDTPPRRTLNFFRSVSEENGISFAFWKADDREIEIPATEMLFIDSLHTYCHLMYELEKFSPKVSKFIAMHDTSFEDDDPAYTGDYSEYPPEYDRSKRSLWPAVVDFLESHPEWMLYERRLNNYGFTILKRITEVE